MYYSQQIKGKHRKRRFKDINEIREILKGRLFEAQNKDLLVFEDERFAVIGKSTHALPARAEIDWSHFAPGSRYSIFQYEMNYFFRTYDGEMHPGSNEFIISIARQDDVYTMALTPLGYKSEQLIFYSL